MKRVVLIVTLAALILMNAAVARAEEGGEKWREIDPYLDALIADRPDVTDSPYAVGKLRLQIETSFEYIRDENGPTTHTYTFPTLVRFGIIDPLEFRIASTLYEIQTTTGQRHQKGFGDVSVGFKWHVLDAQTGGIPAMALMADAILPAGNGPVTTNVVVPVFKVIAEWELPYNFSFGTNLGVAVPERDAAGDKYADFLYSAVIGYAIYGTHDRLRMFVEVSGISPLKSNKSDLRTLNTGLAFLITPNIQMDGFFRIGITPSTPDMMGGLGWAFRFF